MRAASSSGDGDRDKVSHPKRIAFSPKCRRRAARATMHDWAASRNPLPSPIENQRRWRVMSFLESREALAPEGIGKSVRRREDARLLTGGGRYADDFSLPGQVYAHVLRSPHAHARIAGIDMRAALAAPGVLAVLTGADAAQDGIGPIPHNPVPTNPYEV